MAGQSCTNNNRVIHIASINANLAANITVIHNNYRMQVAKGQLSAQPQGINLHRLYYDQQLAKSARKASLTCDLKNVEASDPRWYSVGYNKFLEYSNVPTPTQNWAGAIAAWFDEHYHYNFPIKRKRYNVSRATEHYTQLVWADSRNLGCDFIMFFEAKRPATPYAKLYTCFYGPGGNIPGQPPYIVGNVTRCNPLC